MHRVPVYRLPLNSDQRAVWLVTIAAPASAYLADIKALTDSAARVALKAAFSALLADIRRQVTEQDDLDGSLMKNQAVLRIDSIIVERRVANGLADPCAFCRDGLGWPQDEDCCRKPEAPIVPVGKGSCPIEEDSTL